MIAEYYRLTKPNIVFLISTTALVGMFLSTHGVVPWEVLLYGMSGITLATASAAVFNQVIDRRIDRNMLRTQHRPLAQETIPTPKAIAFGIVLGIIGLAILFFKINALTAWLTFFALIGYAAIYTMFLKRATPQNIVIGGASGAIPPVLGWSAVTGTVDPFAWLLFLMIFLWTPPHFWALAIHRKDDYKAIGMPMLPVTHGTAFTRLHILLYSVLLVLATIFPFLIGFTGLIALSGALALGFWFLRYAWRLYRYPEDQKLPMQMFWFSIWYLYGLFILLLIDHYVFFTLYDVLG